MMSKINTHEAADVPAADFRDRDLPLLVIEDEASVQTLLRAALKKHGYETVIASSGKEGLDLLRQKNFRGVISDVRMPGEVNGADIHSWIVNHRPQLLPRLLFITGDLSGKEAARVLSNSAVPCIEKPFHMAEFMETV